MYRIVYSYVFNDTSLSVIQSEWNGRIITNTNTNSTVKERVTLSQLWNEGFQQTVNVEVGETSAEIRCRRQNIKLYINESQNMQEINLIQDRVHGGLLQNWLQKSWDYLTQSLLVSVVTVRISHKYFLDLQPAD
jgi:hypothetical protein